MNGKSKGFAIINFRYERDAEGAIAAKNGMEINGRAIKVMRITDACLLYKWPSWCIDATMHHDGHP